MSGTYYKPDELADTITEKQLDMIARMTREGERLGHDTDTARFHAVRIGMRIIHNTDADNHLQLSFY